MHGSLSWKKGAKKVIVLNFAFLLTICDYKKIRKLGIKSAFLQSHALAHPCLQLRKWKFNKPIKCVKKQNVLNCPFMFESICRIQSFSNFVSSMFEKLYVAFGVVVMLSVELGCRFDVFAKDENCTERWS